MTVWKLLEQLFPIRNGIFVGVLWKWSTCVPVLYCYGLLVENWQHHKVVDTLRRFALDCFFFILSNKKVRSIVRVAFEFAVHCVKGKSLGPWFKRKHQRRKLDSVNVTFLLCLKSFICCSESEEDIEQECLLQMFSLLYFVHFFVRTSSEEWSLWSFVFFFLFFCETVMAYLVDSFCHPVFLTLWAEIALHCVTKFMWTCFQFHFSSFLICSSYTGNRRKYFWVGVIKAGKKRKEFPIVCNSL